MREWSTKKRHSLGFPFWVLVFSKGVTNFYGITMAMTFSFSKISKTDLETSVEYLQKHFLNQPTCFFFRNRPPIERKTCLPECWDTLPTVLAWNRSLNLLNKKSVAYYIQNICLFPNNLLVCNLKILILTK